MADARERLERLLDDLHKLEINTIEKPNLTATKMPAPILAVHEIYGAYKGPVNTPYGENLVHSDTTDDYRPTTELLREEFVEMMREAVVIKNLMRDNPDPTIKSRRVILARVAASCEVIVGILERNADKITVEVRAADATTLRGMDREQLDQSWQITQSDRAQIRKIWEVGTETVLIQTVIQIEGDVITRLNSSVALGQHPEIMEVHKQSIETSLKMWGQLVDAAERVVRGAATLLGTIVRG